MSQQWLAAWLGSGYVFMALAELRLHCSNYPFLKYVGGQEIASPLFVAYFIWNYLSGSLCLLAFFTAWISIDQSQYAMVFGLICVAFGAGLKIWSMQSLGRLWSYRCIYIPAMPVTQSGPYRWVKHPEYVARFLEVFGLMIACGATSYMWPFLLLQLWLVRGMVSLETRQIRGLEGFEQELTESSGRAALRVDY